MADSLTKPREIYDWLWSRASEALAQGRPEIDPFLSDRNKDDRRAVTLAFRPNATVQVKVNELLHAAQGIVPEQHFYRPEELHTTVLSVIPGSTWWRKQMVDLPAMREVISEVFRSRKPFSIAYRGVTASPGAVMVQGFPTDDSLEKLRDDLRAAFKEKGVGANIDRRYKISAAHITVMRFGAAQSDWKRLLALLIANRNTDFGKTRVETVELLFGDWYASTETCEKLDQYRLG